jgi:hypothetical protein
VLVIAFAVVQQSLYRPKIGAPLPKALEKRGRFVTADRLRSYEE